MKITETRLREIIKEETVAVRREADRSHMGIADGPDVDIKDAIQMLEAEDDPNGTLFHVINRLGVALEKLK